MDAALKKVLSTLDQIAETSLLWKDGLLNPGGPHRRLKGHLFPISIGEDECHAFGRLIDALAPKTCFIVGNAFGLSSAYIAEAMKNKDGQSVITLDNQSEGNGPLCASVAQRLADQMGLGGILKNKKGSSPQDIPGAVEHPNYDLIFIDGLHRHPQVIHDLEGLLPYAHEQSVIVWHDSWIRGVPESVERAKELGYRCLWIPTSCEMIFGAKDPAVFAKLQQAFPEGVEDRSRRSYAVGVWLSLKEIVSFKVSSLFSA